MSLNMCIGLYEKDFPFKQLKRGTTSLEGVVENNDYKVLW